MGILNEFLAFFRNDLNWIDWTVYGAIAVVSLIGVFKCLVPLWSTTRAMHRAVRRLQDHAGEKTDRPVWQEPRFMGKQLRVCWMRFLQNAQQLDRRGLPCNVEDYINDDTVTHGPGNAQLAELIPRLLTSLGILGTFMGMTRGLAGLDTTTTDAMMTGIQTLIDGMRFAFGTSVAGVSCSLVFNMLNRIAQGSSYRAIDDFVESFTQLAMQRPLDNDVQLICQNQDRNTLLGEVTETVSGRITSSIELAIGRAMAPVAASMDRFLVGATQAQIEGVQRITDMFIARMNVSLNDQFLELGRTLSQVNQHEQVNLDRMNQTLSAAQSIMADVTRLHTVSGEILDHFEHYISELTTARQRDEGFEKSAGSLLAGMQAAAKDQSSLIASLRSEEERFGRSLSTAGTDLANTCAVFTGRVGEISRSVAAFEEGMRKLTAVLASRAASLPADGTGSATAEALGSLQRTLADMKVTLERAVPDAQAGEEA